MNDPKFIIVIIYLTFLSCKSEDGKVSQFESLNSNLTQIKFNNKISETEEVNYFTYPYLYMGGGVAIGDINNDGLEDIYFTSNMSDNKLYLNKGNMQFEDISRQAGVLGDERWDTGVSMIDINSDGWLDIYVCVSGKWNSTKNILYINNGDLTFTEQAERYNLADEGNSTQASLIDYDRDGDMDLYVANYPPLDFKSPNFVYSQNMRTPKLRTSDHLYRNDGTQFVDVTEESGLLNFGLSLSATTADLNNDGWMDIYVSNDFASPDFIYINNQDGTFSEKSKEATNHTAYYGMGVDIADINNDGYFDIIQADMTPADNYRSKSNMASMDIDGFNDMISLGIHHQYMENALQLNMAIEDNIPVFGDISRKAGIALTDWSWSPLIADFDNDGLKDIHITNGTKRDINNKDYFAKLKKDKKSKTLTSLQKTLEIPSQKISNYCFKNTNDLSFNDVSKNWGLDEETFSNGSAYGDLDNDGDLDLVINNIDAEASVLKNNSTNNWFQVSCSGHKDNTLGIGTKIEINTSSGKQWCQINTTRGFQSGSQAIAHFGLNDLEMIEKIKITWSGGMTQSLENIGADQRIVVKYKDAISPTNSLAKPKLFSKVDIKGLNFTHQENKVLDFNTEVLLPHATSVYGPAIAIGDLNNDGLDDVFLGGAKDQEGSIFYQQKNNEFSREFNTDIERDRGQEDVDAIIFDANNDGLNDLYVVSGGSENKENHPYYLDRLYLNDGKKLVRNRDALPSLNTAGSVVKAYDYDQDGDLYLLVGGKHIPKSYGTKASSTLLENRSTKDEVKFIDVTDKVSPDLKNIGLVNDIIWSDFNNDQKVDIIVVGEWMPIVFLQNNGESFENVTKSMNLPDHNGWWQSIEGADLDHDGDIDYVVGNVGENYKYQASPEEPFEMFLDDFDQNGNQDIVLGYYNEGVQYPLRGKQCSSEQIPEIKSKFNTYDQFANATLIDVYGEEAIKNVKQRLSAQTFSSIILFNEGSNGFVTKKLPASCQLSSINDIIIDDFDQDSFLDIITAGNMFGSEIETKRNDASIGQYISGDTEGRFNALPYDLSGLLMNKDVKKIKLLKTKDSTLLLVVNNNDKMDILKLNKIES